jgi:hypothetical protein
MQFNLPLSSMNVAVGVVAVAVEAAGCGGSDGAKIEDGQRRRQIGDLPGSMHNSKLINLIYSNHSERIEGVRLNRPFIPQQIPKLNCLP